MQQCSTRGYHNDPFLMLSSRQIERNIMTKAGLLPSHQLPAGPLPMALDALHPHLFHMARSAANRIEDRQQTKLRLGMASAGGLALIVPMIIMVLVPGKTVALVTTCVFILAFVLLIVGATKLGPHEVLAVTAAYAAVLVVFVGASVTPSANNIASA